MFELRVAPEERELQRFYGMPVCLIMKDGTSKIGRLTACRAGRVILNGADGNGGATVSRNSPTRRNRRTGSRKPRPNPAAARPEPQGETDDLALAPLGFGPPEYAAAKRETVSLNAVDSVLIL